MKQERAIQRKVLTPYETSIVDKINSRIEFLDFIKKGVQFYGADRYDIEIKCLKLEKQFDTEPVVKVPYNINKENEINGQVRKIIDICLNQYDDAAISIDEIISSERRKGITDLKRIIYAMLFKYSSLTPSNIAKTFNRTRVVVHEALRRVEKSLNKESGSKFNELLYKINSNIISTLNLKDKFSPVDRQKIDTQKENYNYDELIKRITKVVYGLNSIDFKTKQNISQYNYDNKNFMNSLIITVMNTKINRAYVMYYFSITLKQYNSVKATHIRRMNNSLSYKRKFNAVEKKVLQDTIFISKNRKLEKSK